MKIPAPSSARTAARQAAATRAAVDGVFRALSDPTRRDVLERLGAKPASVSDLAAPYRMALPSFLEHMKMLEGCGLVRSEKKGRVRTYALAPEAFRIAEDWLVRQRRLWERRLDQLDAYLLAMKDTQTTGEAP